MAIGKAEKAAYNDEIKDYKVAVDTGQKQVKDIIVKKKQSPKLSAYYNIELAVTHMRIIGLYLKMSDLSMDMLGIKNDAYLNEARKAFYLVVQMLEEGVGNEVDRSLRTNDQHIAAISKIDPAQLLKFMQKLHSVFEELKIKVGGAEDAMEGGGGSKVVSGGSKWRWSFVEIQARVAVITKNITSFSDIAKLRDPRTPFFRERKKLMVLTLDSLNEAAKQYRTKYELAGKAREDMKKTLELLSALRKIHVLFGESDEAMKLKNVIDAGKQALEAEDVAKEKKKKK